jgi:chromosome segregation ATPase
MNSHKKLYWLFALLIVACFVASCGEMNRANRLIEDSNNAIKESEKYIADAEAKLKQLDSGQDEFPANREQLETTSREAIELLEKAAVKLREAAANYETASKAKIDDKLKEYLSLKSQEFNKHVEHLEAAKDIPKAIIDTSINDAAALNARRAEITNRIEKLKTEWVDLAARAKKIQEENKEKFEP